VLSRVRSLSKCAARMKHPLRPLNESETYVQLRNASRAFPAGTPASRAEPICAAASGAQKPANNATTAAELYNPKLCAKVHHDPACTNAWTVIDGLVVSKNGAARSLPNAQGRLDAANCTCSNLGGVDGDDAAKVAAMERWFADNADMITPSALRRIIGRAKAEERRDYPRVFRTARRFF